MKKERRRTLDDTAEAQADEAGVDSLLVVTASLPAIHPLT